jgi:thioredoxin 1
MESNVPVIILAGAKWCGPCNFLKPMLINVSMEFHDKVKFVSMEIDKIPEIAELLEI